MNSLKPFALAFGCCWVTATPVWAAVNGPVPAGSAAGPVAPPPAAAPQPAAATPAAPPPAAAPLPPAAPLPAAAPQPAADRPAPPTDPVSAPVPVDPAPAAATGLASELPYYVPSAGEVFVAPAPVAPPKPPPPPGLKVELGAYYQFQSLAGGYGAKGFISEVGAGIGFTRLRILLGYIPNNELGVLGLQFPNLTGWKLATFGEQATLSILAPNFQIKAVTNFGGGDFYGSVGANALGLAFVNCAGFPISVKVRGPSVSVWIPFTSQGQTIPNTLPMYGFGAGFDVGFPLF